MKAVRVSGAVVSIFVCAVLVMPTSATASCGDCYWANWMISHANGYALQGVQSDSGCSFPWGGTEGIVGWLLDDAYDLGTEAEALLWTAYQTCSCSSAVAALNKAIEARDKAQDAVDMCANQYCTDNDACPYASQALSWYQNSVTAIQDCRAQACAIIIQPPIDRQQ